METHRVRNDSVASKRKTVLLDSSFLLKSLDGGWGLEELMRNLTGPVRLITIDRVVYELQRMARSVSSETAGLARISLDQLEQWKVPVTMAVFGLGDVDSAILATSLAVREPVTVATADRRLRQSLRKLGISTLNPAEVHPR